MIHLPYKDGSGGLITWNADDWKAGLGPQGQFGQDLTLKQTTPTGWAGLNNIDPFLNYGILRPGFSSGSTFTNSSILAGVMVATQFINNTLLYGLDAGGKVHQANFITGAFVNSGGTFPHTIAGTTPIGQDSLLYRHNLNGVSVISLFYSYYNSVNWNVGAYINQTVFEDAYMSGGGTGDSPDTPLDIITGSPDGNGKDIVQKSAPHPLCIGADGLLYIGSGRYLHAYDGNTGTNGTFSSRVLTLPQGFQIIAIRKSQDQLLIAGNYYSNQGAGSDGTGEAQLYVWNYVDLDITQMIPLEDPYVSCLFLWKGTPTVITSGKVERNGTNKIKTITGNTVQKVADFDGVMPIQRGVLVSNDLLYINAGGKIIAYGDRFTQSDAINHIATTIFSGISGALVYNYSQFCILGFSDNGTNRCANNFNGGPSSGVAYPYSYQPDFPVGKIGKIKSVQIEFFEPVVADINNGNLTMTLITDYGTTTNNVLVNLSSVSLPLVKRYYLKADGTNFPTFSTIGPEFVFNVGSLNIPSVSTLSVEYETVSIPPNV